MDFSIDIQAEIFDQDSLYHPVYKFILYVGLSIILKKTLLYKKENLYSSFFSLSFPNSSMFGHTYCVWFQTAWLLLDFFVLFWKAKILYNNQSMSSGLFMGILDSKPKGTKDLEFNLWAVFLKFNSD